MSNHNLYYLPTQLRKLTNLKTIDLSDNNLENVDLSFLSNLETCYLQGNKLKEVPESLANMKSLKKLDLSDNQIYKNNFLDTLISNNSKLKHLYLDKNLLKNKDLNPNPKKFEIGKDVLAIKVGHPFNLSSIIDSFTISGEPLSSNIRDFAFRYLSEDLNDNDYFDANGIAVKEGSIEGQLFILDSITNENIMAEDTFVLNILPDKNIAPSINLEENISIFEGEQFDEKKDVLAEDFEDGDLTSSILVSGDSVDTSVPGEYHLKYSVTDQDGLTSTRDRTVIVKEDALPIIQAKDRTIKQGSIFDAYLDVTAFDELDGNLTESLSVSGDTVDTSTTGKYSVTYSATDSKLQTTTKTITVNVVEDLTPEIIAEDIVILEGSVFDAKESIIVKDEEDGDLTEFINVTSNNVVTALTGVYEVIYNIEDSYGNKSEKSVSVTVVANNGDAPVIKGDSLSVTLGDSFEATKGLSALDGKDGSLTDKIQLLTSDVDTSKLGKYTATYSVENSDGNISTFKRKVNVVNNESPIITASDVTVIKDSIFNPLIGIKAIDKEDGNLTDSIKVLKNEVDISIEGVYPVVYSVTDSAGNLISKEIQVTVKDNIIKSNSLNEKQTENNLLIYGALSTISVIGLTIINKKDKESKSDK